MTVRGQEKGTLLTMKATLNFKADSFYCDYLIFLCLWQVDVMAQPGDIAPLKTSTVNNGSRGHIEGETEPLAHHICSKTPGLKRYILWVCNEALIEIFKYPLFL